MPDGQNGAEKKNVDAHWHTERRDRMAADGFKTLLLLNGGGAVALLAFLQALWNKGSAAPIIPWVIAGLAALAIGALVSGVTHFLRMNTSWAHQLTGRSGKTAQCVETAVTVLALLLFAIGIGIIVWGAATNLPTVEGARTVEKSN